MQNKTINSLQFLACSFWPQITSEAREDANNIFITFNYYDCKPMR